MPLQQLHKSAASRIIHGRFDVRYGTHWFSRACAWLLRLPPEANGCELVLTIEARQARELWMRRFGRRSINTIQWAGEDGVLHERFGPLEFAFALQTGDGTLAHIQRSATLRIGRMSFRLPASLAPDVRGREFVENGQTRVEVEVRIPFGGLLLVYRGSILSMRPV